MSESVPNNNVLSIFASATLPVADPGGGGGTQGTFPPLELSNALLLGRGLAVAMYISLTSHLLPPESRLPASYTTHWSIVREQYYVATPTIILYSQDVPPLLKILNPPLFAVI